MEEVKLENFTNFLIDIDGMGKGKTEGFHTSILNKPSLFSKADFNQRLALEVLDEDLLQVIQQLPFFRKSVKKLLKIRIKPLMRGGSHISKDDYKKIEQVIQPGLNDLEILFNECSSMKGGMEGSIVRRERTENSPMITKSPIITPTVHQTRPWTPDEIMLLFSHSLCMVFFIGALAVCAFIFIKGAATYRDLNTFFTSISSIFPEPQGRWCDPGENPYEEDTGWFSSDSSLKQVCRPYNNSWSSFGQYIWGGITTPLEIAGSGINLLGSVLGTGGIAFGFYLIVNVLAGPLMTKMNEQATHIRRICMEHRGEISGDYSLALAMGSSQANARREHEQHMQQMQSLTNIVSSFNSERRPATLPDRNPGPEPEEEPEEEQALDTSRLITNPPRSSSVGGKRKKKRKSKSKKKRKSTSKKKRKSTSKKKRKSTSKKSRQKRKKRR